MSTGQQGRRAAKADPRTTVLLTGFGPFPGVLVNATMRLVPLLAERATAAFPGVRFVTELLATEWQTAPQRLTALIEELQPDLVLHFGVSSRARGFEIEQRAHNTCSATPDAAGMLPSASSLRQGGPEALRASLPVPHLVLALRRRGIAAFASRDAGGYLCNAVLYHSLSLAADAGQGRRVGFVHIPTSMALPGPNRGRVGASALTWPQVVEGGLEIIGGCLGRMRRRQAAQGARAHPARGGRKAGHSDPAVVPGRVIY